MTRLSPSTLLAAKSFATVSAALLAFGGHLMKASLTTSTRRPQTLARSSPTGKNLLVPTAMLLGLLDFLTVTGIILTDLIERMGASVLVASEQPSDCFLLVGPFLLLPCLETSLALSK